MKKLVVLTIGLLCSFSVAGPLDVSEIVASDTDTLKTHQANAQVAREALTMLLEGVETLSAKAAGQQDVKTTTQQRHLREELVRQDEPSVAQIPTSFMSAQARTKFVALRDQIRTTQDIIFAASELAAFVQQTPNFREARLALGRLQILLDQPNEALATFAPLLLPIARTSHPDWQPWFWAGTAYLVQGDIEQARKYLDVAVAKNSAVVEVWIQLAVLEQEVDNHAGALQYVAIAEQLDPSVAAIHLNRAYSLEQLGRFEDALQAYQRFLISQHDYSSQSLRPSVVRRISTISAVIGSHALGSGRRQG